ncbi:hypothetical protein M011DRAFT_196457 [Sporormia fimetaria CBS 119925]|uniref:Uncharacterized protein n=1 Tax=Sporormia fimetaria CBS 119925 TaxID=1340428 RepID=A0A6A6V2V8_9PLEO|nr:hypothetical protein M011DRAFT_196457 [Sporormia fimetaria CBS 119925]
MWLTRSGVVVLLLCNFYCSICMALILHAACFTSVEKNMFRLEIVTILECMLYVEVHVSSVR